MSRAGRSIAAALAFGAVLAVGPAQAEPRVEVSVGRYSTIEAATPVTMTQDDYLITIKGLLSGREHVDQSDEEYVQGGKDICADIDNGSTMTSFLEQVAPYGGDPAFYRAAIRAAVYTFCPADAAVLWR